MTYKQNWGLSRRHYQGKTSPLNQDMPHMERLDEQSKKKFAGIETKNLAQAELAQEMAQEQGFNMTPNSTPEEDKAMQDKYDRTHLTRDESLDVYKTQ